MSKANLKNRNLTYTNTQLHNLLLLSYFCNHFNYFSLKEAQIGGFRFHFLNLLQKLKRLPRANLCNTILSPADTISSDFLENFQNMRQRFSSVNKKIIEKRTKH